MLDLRGEFGTAEGAAELAVFFGKTDALRFRGAARDEEMIDLVSGRLVAECIGDKAATSFDACFLQNFIEQLSTAPDKGVPLPNFPRPRCLAHQRNAIPALGTGREVVFDFGGGQRR